MDLTYFLKNKMLIRFLLHDVPKSIPTKIRIVSFSRYGGGARRHDISDVMHRHHIKLDHLYPNYQVLPSLSLLELIWGRSGGSCNTITACTVHQLSFFLFIPLIMHRIHLLSICVLLVNYQIVLYRRRNSLTHYY